MSLEKLYRAYGVQVATPSEPKHFRHGWLNTPCPHCTGSFGYHLGYNLKSNYYSCFRCGWHPLLETLSKLIHQDKPTTRRLMAEYEIKRKTNRYVKKDPKVNIKRFTFPTGLVDLKKRHKEYIAGRGFDPDLLEREFKLKATSPYSLLDKIPYGYRILAPIYWQEYVVSFQARDYTGKQDRKYMACPMAREKLHHQHLLYMNPRGPEDIGFAVEGIFDVWRFIRYAFGTFGIDFTQEQLRLMAKLYKKIFIIFDPEPQAQVKAAELQTELEFRGVEVQNVLITTDPGDMKQDDADHLIRELTKVFV